MKIKGIEHLSPAQIEAAVDGGARFVLFPYCLSMLVVSFKRSSDIYFIPAGESVAGKAALHSLASLLLGWWGIPWGPIWTVSTVFTNLTGGQDVTSEVMSQWRASSAASTAFVQAPGRG